MTSNDDSRDTRALASAFFEDILGPSLPWYDSNWLRLYRAVYGYLRASHPDRLQDFVQMIDPLRTRSDFVAHHLPKFIDDPTMAAIRTEVNAITAAPVSTYEREQFGRDLLHDRPFFTKLAISLVDQVGALVGEPVEPRYNFLSLYGADGVCQPHMDAPEAKWTLDICIDQSDRWPLYLSQVTPWPNSWDRANNESWQQHIRSTNDFNAMAMEPSDAVLFAGSSQWHYRDPFPATRSAHAADGYCRLLFLHYIPAGCSEIVDPELWHDQLGIPALRALTRRYRSHYGTGQASQPPATPRTSG